MTDLIEKLIQQQTRPAGVANFHQRHCHDVITQTQTDRLMQRLQLPEQLLSRYTRGLLQSDRITQRFNLRRVELTEWGQPPEIEWRSVLPSQGISSQLPNHFTKGAFDNDSFSSENRSYRSTAEGDVVGEHTIPSKHQTSSLPYSLISSDGSKNEAMVIKRPSTPLSHTEPTTSHPPADRHQSLTSPSGSPDLAPITRNKVPFDQVSASGDLDQAPPTAFRVRRGRTHVSTELPNSLASGSAAPEISNLVLPHSAMQPHSGSSQRSVKTINQSINHTNPLESSKGSLKTNDPVLNPENLLLEMPARFNRSPVKASDSQPPIGVSQQEIFPAKSQSVLSLKAKLSEPQSTSQPIPQFPHALPVSKAKSSRSPHTQELTSDSLPPLISVKPQRRLLAAPAPALSDSLSLIHRSLDVPRQKVEEPAPNSVPAINPPKPTSLPSTATSGESTVEAINIGKVAEEVSRLLSRRLMLERERRGIRQ